MLLKWDILYLVKDNRNIIATKCIANMPAVFINGKLISQGKALSEQEVKDILMQI